MLILYTQGHQDIRLILLRLSECSSSLSSVLDLLVSSLELLDPHLLSLSSKQLLPLLGLQLLLGVLAVVHGSSNEGRHGQSLEADSRKEHLVGLALVADLEGSGRQDEGTAGEQTSDGHQGLLLAPLPDLVVSGGLLVAGLVAR